MASLESKTGFDSDYSVGSFIPAGAIVMVGGSAYTVSQLNDIDINGICPCDGRALSRTTYANLWTAIGGITFTSANITSGSPSISGLSGMSASIHVGWGIAGTGIPSGATILSVTNSTTVSISINATSTSPGTGNIAISPHGFTGAGNTTTFNVPKLDDSLYYLAMPSDSIVRTSAASGSNTHTHTTTTNATGVTTSGSFPHGHTTYHAYNENGDHGVAHGAAWVGVNATSAHNAAVFKNDGSCAGAAINHSHTSIYREYVGGNSGNHSHGVNAYVGDALDTAHTHDYTTSSTLANSTVTPPYVSSLFFIKL